ncbi:Glutathione biosynthesis bifunctional gshAB [Gossypium arboreum]|uniref:Glutathione biosynthesis bifunctional gshAB n=1 Tax=Gossypium arboreum TaxID=29729 RepID=A0A0B0PFQ8_GOSAR|nr:Glutathione biosynthesis bifunctional gshAB [Gossypium arboreum]
MPKSPKNWPFSNRTILGLGRDTPVCEYSSPRASILPNGHGHVTRPCEEI